MKNNFSLKINGKTHKVVMTMGLLHEVCSTIGHIELLAEAGYNPDLRHDLLVVLLSPRDEYGEILEGQEIRVKTLEADPSEIVQLIDWATEHAADFLLKTLHGSKKILEAKKEMLENFLPSSTGGAA